MIPGLSPERIIQSQQVVNFPIGSYSAVRKIEAIMFFGHILHQDINAILEQCVSSK